MKSMVWGIRLGRIVLDVRGRIEGDSWVLYPSANRSPIPKLQFTNKQHVGNYWTMVFLSWLLPFSELIWNDFTQFRTSPRATVRTYGPWPDRVRSHISRQVARMAAAHKLAVGPRGQHWAISRAVPEAHEMYPTPVLDAGLRPSVQSSPIWSSRFIPRLQTLSTSTL